MELCQKLEMNIHTESKIAIVRRDAYASLLLALINEIYKKSGEKIDNEMPEYVREAMQYMEQNLQSPFRLQELADSLHITPSYLSTQFKYHTGLTLRDYFLDRKLAHAKLLLEQGANVTTACFDSGFHDYANFIRSFKKKEGIPPGKYIKRRLPS